MGCGSGATTRAAARNAVDGQVLGVDLPGPMLALSTRRSAGLPNVRYEQADAQVHPFPECDVVMSRNGVMFFGDPERAFANLARTLRPGGRLVLMTWQAVASNEWQQVIRGALRAGQAPAPSGFADPAVDRHRLHRRPHRAPRGGHVPRRDRRRRGRLRDGQFASAIAGMDDPDAAVTALRADFAKHQSPTGIRLG